MKKIKLTSLYHLIFFVGGFVSLTIGCGKHEIENFGYNKEVNPEVAEEATTWQDRFEEAVNQIQIEDFKNLLTESDNEKIDYSVLLKNGRTPLTHAVVSGSKLFVYLLLQKNIDVNQKDGQGKTAMDYAIELNKERVKLLLDPTLQLLLQDEFYTAILQDSEDISSLVKFYLEAGVDPNFIYEKTGETPLTQAIKIKSVSVLQILRWTDEELGLTATQINLPNAEGKTPLDIALELKFNRAIKAIEDLNAIKQ